MRRVLGLLIALSGAVCIHGLNLQCNFNSNSKWNYVSGQGCEAFNVNITSQNETVTSINDDGNFDGSSYKTISIEHQTVFYLPVGLGRIFPNVVGFRVSNSRLKEVKRKNIRFFPKLEELWLSFNELEILHSDLFEANPKLRAIFMERNKIIFVGSNILTPLKSLETAVFNLNSCIDEAAYSPSEISSLETSLTSGCGHDAITHLLQGKQYEANKEKLKEIEEDTKSTEIQEYERKLKILERIVDAATQQLYIVSKNAPKSPPENVNMRCDLSDKNCEVIDFIVKVPDTKLVKITGRLGHTVGHSDRIKKLMITNQQTLYLPNNLGEHFWAVQKFHITNSGFFEIKSDTFAKMTSLTSLKMNHNKLYEIPSNCFNDNINLVELAFAYNKIQTIADDAFIRLGQLKTLSIHHNQLTLLKPEMFAPLPSLEILRLQYNQISAVPAHIFTGSPNLSQLDISYNKLAKLSGDLFTFNNNIAQFRAAGNKLKFVDKNLLKSLEKSEQIDFSFNECIDFMYTKSTDQNLASSSLNKLVLLQCANESL